MTKLIDQTPEDLNQVNGPSLAEQWFGDVATAGMRALCKALELPDDCRETADQLVPALLGDWYSRRFGITPPTSTDITDDGSPFEYSVVVAAPRPEVRLLVEPQSPQQPTNPVSNWVAGWATLRSLEEQGLVDLSSAEIVRDLFEPRSGDAGFGLWLGAVIRPGGQPMIKAYFDPNTDGADNTYLVVAEAMERLGYAAGWTWLSRHALENPRIPIPFVSLDLTDADDSRIKVYGGAAARDAASLDDYLIPLPGYVPGTARKFSDDLLGPGTIFDQRRPLICWGMTSRDRERPTQGTLHLPVRCHVDNDQTLVRRIHRMLPASDAQALERAVRAVANRPLTADSGLIAWVSRKLGPGAPHVTAYLSVEGYRGTPA
ncbi:tryptophan dimethylallyltransferase family protein [Acrocarpospora catenulata]|uniref:tryptophan dimethylallyltransferase family protein n=1 Tax=Acrocarpospora catenulata TaxID=2836182 RepID=UPI001BDAC9E1|nr:tryptophan dimethylallyltransferase family protein [Acrocarpospora catenulata]